MFTTNPQSEWVRRADARGEHLMMNEIGHVVRVRAAWRCDENNGFLDIRKLVATPSILKPDITDEDMEGKEQSVDADVRISSLCACIF